jgi:hypothetical protein
MEKQNRTKPNDRKFGKSPGILISPFQLQKRQSPFNKKRRRRRVHFGLSSSDVTSIYSTRDLSFIEWDAFVDFSHRLAIVNLRRNVVTDRTSFHMVAFRECFLCVPHCTCKITKYLCP